MSIYIYLYTCFLCNTLSCIRPPKQLTDNSCFQIFSNRCSGLPQRRDPEGDRQQTALLTIKLPSCLKLATRFAPRNDSANIVPTLLGKPAGWSKVSQAYFSIFFAKFAFWMVFQGSGMNCSSNFMMRQDYTLDEIRKRLSTARWFRKKTWRNCWSIKTTREEP